MPRHFSLDTNTASDDAVPLAMTIALEPSVATKTNHCFVPLITASPLCRGQSVVDHLHILKQEPNAEVVAEASREKFLHMLFDAVA